MDKHISILAWLRRLGASSALLLAGSAFAPASLTAALFLDPSGGVAITPDDADNGTDVALFWSDSFFGSFAPGITTISTNGFIRFGDGDGHGDYFLQPLGTNGVNRISPMWMNLNLGTSGQILTQLGAGDSYLAVTWQNMENAYSPGAYATFQAILFNSAVTLNGVSFNLGDIVFSYGDLGLYNADLETIIGLETNSGDIAPLNYPNIDYDLMPPDSEGWHRYSALGEFPVGDDQYVLFRPDGVGYDVSIETTAIPEPSNFAGLAGALVLAGSLVRRRR